MAASNVADDSLIHLIAADADGLRIDDAAQADHGDLRRAAAHVHDQATAGFGDRQTGADRGRHRLLDQQHLAGTGALGAFLDRPALDGGAAGGHADNDQRAGEAAAAMDLADEVLDHLFGDFEIGNDAVTQRTDGLDVAGRAAEHQLGLFADG